MYHLISDYGIIGNMQTTALVSSDGSIDYCSMPYLDSPTLFAALLDDEKGGTFSIQPDEPFSARQEYISDTNILATTFTTLKSRAILFDFMPVNARTPADGKEHRIHRCLTVQSGTMSFRLHFSPRPDYARTVPELSTNQYAIGITAPHTPLILWHSLEEYRLDTPSKGTADLFFTLHKDNNARFQLIWGDAGGSSLDRPPACDLQENIDYWKEWIEQCSGRNCLPAGRWKTLVNRSLLTLKLLTFSPTGAIAAAATTSLPESLGGERNWDYRYTWIRDASFTLKAFFALGHVNEADHFLRWLHHVYRENKGEKLNIMYSLRGSENLEEHILDHLKGYMSSRPVRTGNLASRQNQWDIYGEIMDSALRLSDYAGKIDNDLWPFFVDICNLACKNWNKPDEGIWEVRNGPAHFVYSKVMCWVALDRGIIISRRFGFDAPAEKWIQCRESIRQDILTRGFDPEIGSFVQRYGSRDLDASLLLLPLVNFLPPDDERVQGTIEACMLHLMHNGFLRRYNSDDGLESHEGEFLLCNFWLTECLAISGRTDEAEALLEHTMQASNHLGIFTEEYDSDRRILLGNFPQAFSHIGFINAVIAIRQNRQSLETPRTEPSVIERLQRMIPLQVTLNEADGEHDIAYEPSGELDRQLKQQLTYLQGAFFDSRKGNVDYRALRHSTGFREYRELSRKLLYYDLSTLRTDELKKAFWINLYNILIIDGIIEFDIQHSVLEITSFFSRISYIVGGLKFSPDDIEHGILRRNRPHPAIPLRPFGSNDPKKSFMVETFDPRIHFALVCASSSCPPIEFYDHRIIDRQLDIAARSFINRFGLITERSDNIVRLSKIFQWYRQDFGRNRKETLLYAASFASEETARWIRQNLQEIRTEYLEYNWNLNSTLG
ncbi:MAG: DUF547 domain-containing protein [Prosthecochloris sp.]|nr:DUF547 domain-containing protein [Prosthecochloris sp.]